MRDEGQIRPVTVIVSAAGGLITILIGVVGYFLVQLAGDVRDMNSRVWSLSQSVAVLTATMPKECRVCNEQHKEK